MKKILAILGAFCLSVTSFTAYAETSTTDILDNSAEQQEVKENGIPTASIVQEMKENADSLYDAGDYKKAISAYHDTAKKANYLANIMRQCIEPYYSSKSDYPNTPDEIWDDLVEFEKQSNDMIEIRDLCYVYEGICYNQTGDSENALAVLYRALDLITDTETEAWVLASKEMMSIIQYEPIGTAYADARKQAEEYSGKPFAELKEVIGEPEDSIFYEEKYPLPKYSAYTYEGFTVFTEYDENDLEIVDFISSK